MKKQWQEEISLLIIHQLLCPCPIFWGDLIILFSLFLAFLSPRMFSDICNADNNTVQCYSLPFVYIFKCQNTNTTLMQIPIMGIHLNYPFQVENGGHLCKTSKLVPDGPGGHRCEVGHQRAKLFIKLQPSELGKGDQRQWMSYMYQRIPRKHTQRKKRMLLVCSTALQAFLCSLINHCLMIFHQVCQWRDERWCRWWVLPPHGPAWLLTLLKEHFRTVFSISTDIKLVIRPVSAS